MPRPNTKLNTPEKRARVGERIKIAATQAGLSLKELAEYVGISPHFIYQYVRGIIMIPADILEKIAAVTRVHTEFFDPDKDGRTTLALQADQPIPDGAALANTGSEPGTRARIQAELRHLNALQEAQYYPKRNRSAYMSTLEQMLSLARTMDDRKKEGWLLWQLGCMRTQDNSLETAKENLIAARDLFATEDMEEYHNLATQDLIAALITQGAFDAAESYLEELLESSANINVRWRALIAMGNLRFRQHRLEEALDFYCQAATLIETLDPDTRENEAMLHLRVHMADIIRATGHYEEAATIWSRTLQQATQDRQAEDFLEALMEIAQLFQSMGRIGEARERLELAVVLAGFLFEDEAKLSIARALLADVLVTMGSIDSAKENARASLRIAHKVRAARPTILSALALAETNLAAGQWKDALEDAQEALDEATRTKRTREVARSRELRARAYLGLYEERVRAGDDIQAREALNRAFGEATTSLELALKSEAVQDILAARITLAYCHFRQGDDASAENEAQSALELSQSGAVGLTRLLGNRVEALPELLRSGELNLPVIFAGRKLTMPTLEWQAHYLKGVLLAKRLGPEAGYANMRDAAQLVSGMLASLNQTEALVFQQRHPEINAVFDKLSRFALTSKEQKETKALLERARWIEQRPAFPALTE